MGSSGGRYLFLWARNSRFSGINAYLCSYVNHANIEEFSLRAAFIAVPGFFLFAIRIISFPYATDIRHFQSEAFH